MPGEKKSQDYKFIIDKQHLVAETELITGRTIFSMAGIALDGTFGLYQKLKGKAMERIKDLDREIDLSQKGIERFVSLPLEQQEGEVAQQIEVLPENDEAYLNSLDLDWEVIADVKNYWLVIYNHPIPDGYNHKTSDVSLMLARSYPDSQIDMVYFGEHLSLTSSRAIPRLVNHIHVGRTWQRWSRHRTPQNPWRIGIDCVETHMAQVRHWLERELN